MSAPLLPPVPPIGKDGFQDPVWPKWLNALRNSVVYPPSSIAVATKNGFSGSVAQPPGGQAVITLETTVVGMLKGSFYNVIPAVAGVDYLAPDPNNYAEMRSGTQTITSGTQVLMAINLPAGDWDVTGVAAFTSMPTTTVVTSAQAGISTTTAFDIFGSSVLYTAGIGAFALPTVRVSLSAAGVAYLVVSVAFSGTTCLAQGYLRARRTR